MSNLQFFHWRWRKCLCLQSFPILFQRHSNYHFNSSIREIFWQHRQTLMMIETCFFSPFPPARLFSKPPCLFFNSVSVKKSLSQARDEQQKPIGRETCSPLPGGNRRSLVFSSFATILSQPREAANGGYCFFAGYGFVLDPCAKCKHVISPHLLYPKTFPMSIFDFQVHLCTDWNPPNMLLHKCKPTRCWFSIKCSYASTLPFQSLPRSCSMCPFNTFFSPSHKEIPVFVAGARCRLFHFVLIYSLEPAFIFTAYLSFVYSPHVLLSNKTNI